MYVQPKNPRLAEEYEKARQLRYLGGSVKQIARWVHVSQSTVSVWVRDIELLPRHKAANLERAAGYRSDAWAERARVKRRTFQKEGRARARLDKPMHVAGCMLYWAEGAKDRNVLKFSNSDPGMHRIFVRFLRECFEIPNDQLKFNINAYTSNGRTIDEIEEYWLGILELPRQCARKHIVNHFPTSSSGMRKNKLPNGVCNLAVARSTWLVQHIFGAIQEYSGMDQPKWLDGPPRKQKR